MRRLLGMTLFAALGVASVTANASELVCDGLLQGDAAGNVRSIVNGQCARL